MFVLISIVKFLVPCCSEGARHMPLELSQHILEIGGS
jgi:hypothetical protein